MTKAEWAAFREQALGDAAHLRELAEKALAELEKQAGGDS
jgi:hypothetical protein